ncbi:MAG: hypothetical protein IPP86_02545 [Bacteroidetes bacterium]|nr:hypothetical protein [Bacteroidota bacterium]
MLVLEARCTLFEPVTMVTLSLLEGTPFGIQFVLVDQSVDAVPFQVKLPAKA